MKLKGSYLKRYTKFTNLQPQTPHEKKGEGSNQENQN